MKYLIVISLLFVAGDLKAWNPDKCSENKIQIFELLLRTGKLNSLSTISLNDYHQQYNRLYHEGDLTCLIVKEGYAYVWAIDVSNSGSEIILYRWHPKNNTVEYFGPFPYE